MGVFTNHFQYEIDELAKAEKLIAYVRDCFTKHEDAVNPIGFNVQLYNRGHYPRVGYELIINSTLRTDGLSVNMGPSLYVKFNLNCGYKTTKATGEVPYLHPNVIAFDVSMFSSTHWDYSSHNMVYDTHFPAGYSAEALRTDTATCTNYLKSIKNDTDTAIKEIIKIAEIKTFNDYIEYVKECQKNLERREIMKDSKRRTKKEN